MTTDDHLVIEAVKPWVDAGLSNAEISRRLWSAVKAAKTPKEPKSHGNKILPFGYRRSGIEVVEDSNEKAIIDLVLRYRASGMTFRQITERLIEEGYKSSRSGNQLTLTQISRIVYAHLPKQQDDIEEAV